MEAAKKYYEWQLKQLDLVYTYRAQRPEAIKRETETLEFVERIGMLGGKE